MKNSKEFNNLDELINYSNWESSDYWRASQREGGDGWSGCDSFKEALNLARKGWSEGTEKIKKLSDELSTIIGQKIVKADIVHDVQGSMVDVDAYLTGIPENMIEMVEGQGHGVKMTKVTINAAFYHGIHPETVTKRGAAIVAMIDALESAGNRVELDLLFPIKKNSHRYYLKIRTKKADEHLDVDRIAFTLANAGFFRRIIFSVLEKEPKEVRGAMGFGRGYGQTTDARPEDIGDIHLENLTDNDWEYKSIDDTIKWITNKLESAGVELVN